MFKNDEHTLKNISVFKLYLKELTVNFWTYPEHLSIYVNVFKHLLQNTGKQWNKWEPGH